MISPIGDHILPSGIGFRSPSLPYPCNMLLISWQTDFIWPAPYATLFPGSSRERKWKDPGKVSSFVLFWEKCHSSPVHTTREKFENVTLFLCPVKTTVHTNPEVFRKKKKRRFFGNAYQTGGILKMLSVRLSVNGKYWKRRFSKMVTAP